jgi:hypothetical protein
MRTLRVLAILTKRQMTDDGALLIAALAGAMVFLFALGLLAFIYPQGFLLHVTTILIILPFLIGTGFFVFGVVQVHGDENRGIPVMLSVLSVTPGQIILARIVVGILFVGIIVVSVSLAITGAVVSGLVQWPESLVPDGLIDLFVALLLIGLTCYCLGLLAGRGAASLIAPFRVLPLGSILVSLIVIKGFGRPLAIVLVPFIVVSLAYLLISAKHPRPATITLGLAVVIVTAVPFYWLRYCSDAMTALVMLEASDKVTLTLYRNFRPMPDFYSGGPFTVQAEINSRDFPIDYGRVHFLLRPIGIMSYLQGKEPGGDPIDPGYFGHFWGLYYDQQKGLLVDRSTRGTLYAGPEGVAATPVERLGRFSSPIVYRTRRNRRIAYGTLRSEWMVFDRQSQCFYAISFDEQDVRRELRLTDAAFQPVDPIRSKLGGGICSIRYSYPSARDKDVLYAGDSTGDYLPVVDESGAVAVIDQRTWRLLSGAGHLPRPRTFFGRGSSKPRDLFDYDTAIIVKRPENEYAGLITASVSRQGSLATIAVFDKDGRLIEESQGGRGFSPVLLFTTKGLAECLHPPVMTLASFFTAYSFEAGATHQALFLMPNSFVAQQRDRETSFVFQFLAALLFLLPALVFAGFLSWRVVRDAAVMGLSRRARRLWGLGTFAFGLPAYITCRLTRPRTAALALCRNCGRGRRVDMDACHHCGGEWDVPILEPPAWRVTRESVGNRETPA